MDNSSKYIKFRREYPNFIYHSYNINEEEDKYIIEFYFEIVGLSEFRPQIILDKKYFKNIDLEDIHIKNLVFNIGMVELVSYLKITCSPNVYVKCGNLDDFQVNWFKKLYVNGLGEFFYKNNIPIDFDFITITSNHDKKLEVYKSSKNLSGNLIPIGGGKDSCVSIELLKSLKSDNTTFIVNPRGATKNTNKEAGYLEDSLIVTRKLDQNMLKLNEEGFLNGHTPFSAMLAFLSNFIAYISGKKYVVLSNESSANQPNVLGTNINHQYSKSIEFENDFREYEEKYLKTNVKYFSLLRPLTELQITALFSKYKKYHSVFKSCNVGSKKDIWCCDCPKCLFVYIMLGAFLSKEELINIFGENLLDKKVLKDMFIELIGKGETKPFECVGTYEEINYALCVNILNSLNGKSKLDNLLQLYFEEYMYSNRKNIEKYILENKDKLLYGYIENNNLPEEYENLLKKRLNEEL